MDCNKNWIFWKRTSRAFKWARFRVNPVKTQEVVLSERETMKFWAFLTQSLCRTISQQPLEIRRRSWRILKEQIKGFRTAPGSLSESRRERSYSGANTTVNLAKDWASPEGRRLLIPVLWRWSTEVPGSGTLHSDYCNSVVKRGQKNQFYKA